MSKHRLRKWLEKMLLITLGVGTAASLVAGCKELPPKKVVEVGPLSANTFGRKWVAKLNMGADRVWQLHLSEDAVFVYTDNHDSYQLKRDTGAMVSLSEVTSSASRLAPPVVLADQIVYPSDTTLEIYEKTGKKIRSMRLNFAMRSPAIGIGRTLYVGADFPGSARFVAIDLDKPNAFLKWGFVTAGGVSAAPAMFQNQIFVGSEDNRVYAVNENRTAAWGNLEGYGFETAGRVLADVKADEFGVYVASTDTKLYCLDRVSGKIKWQYYSQHPLVAAPIVTSTTVYQAVPDLGLVALDKLNGKYNRDPKWITKGVLQILSEDGQYVYALQTNHSIVAIDKQTGEPKFASQRNDFSIYATNTKDATIFAATRNGDVYAITPILRPGTVGEMVLDERRMEPLAAAN